MGEGKEHPEGNRSLNPRALALEILQRVTQEGAYAHILLDASLNRTRGLARRDRALVTELVNGTLRWLKRIDWVLAQFSTRPLRTLSPPILNLLRMGLYQLLFLDRIPSRAVIHESVNLAKNLGFPSQAGYVNALLRRIDRTREGIPYPDPGSDPMAYMATVHAFPEWIVECWATQWGMAGAEKMCEATNRIPPMTLRTNTLRISREDLAIRLGGEGRIRKTCYSPDGLIVEGRSGPLSRMEAFRKGWFTVQDEASQLISLWLSPAPGERVLDACSAPGGKATHLAQIMGNRGHVVAMDIHESRLGLLTESCQRMGLTIVEAVVADLTREEALSMRGPFDRILLDPPCSGLGILRRHPDAKWRKDPREIGPLVELQRTLLDRVSKSLKPGGTLVYSVCTMNPEENEGIVQAFLGKNRHFRLAPSRDPLPESCRDLIDGEGFLRTLPSRHGMDGFFAAKMVRII